MNSSTLLPLFTVILLWLSPVAHAAFILTNFLGGDEPTDRTHGGGNLVDIFNAAARVWEGHIVDPGYTVTIDYRWAPLSNSFAAHSLIAQGGSPHRETRGRITFDNDIQGPIDLFLDPTPLRNEEWQTPISASIDLSAGPIEYRRSFRDSTGDALNRIDVFTTAMHEIGHALGLSLSNTVFKAEAGDGDIDITAPHPFAGTTIPLATNVFGTTSHFDIGGPLLGLGGLADERKYPSELDIIAIAQLSQFKNLNLVTIPEPTGAILILLGTASSLFRRRRSWQSAPPPLGRLRPS